MKPPILLISFFTFISVPAMSSSLTRLTSTLQGNHCMIDGTLPNNIKISIDVEMADHQQAGFSEQEAIDKDPGWIKGRDLTIWQEVKKVSFNINGTPVLIPQSAFEDIYSVSSMEITKKNGFFILDIGGGDASGSYSVSFKLVGSKHQKGSYRIAERVLRSGEFSDEIWEKTTYQNTVWDDPDM